MRKNAYRADAENYFGNFRYLPLRGRAFAL